MTDWGSKDSLADSARYRERWKNEGDEDRTAEYQRWRRSLGRNLYVTDIDQVEYRRDSEDAIHPVATLELTRVDPYKGETKRPVPSYFDAILARYNERDDQGTTARMWAWMMGIPCYLVAFQHDLSEFYVYNLSADRGWAYLSKHEYAAFLAGLGGGT